MKECNYCGHENEESAVACSGCGKPLGTRAGTKAVPDLNDPALNPVIVATFENAEHASILKARLEQEGINAWVPEEFSVEFPPQGASVQVAAKDALAAGSITAKFMKQTEPEKAEANEARSETANVDAASERIPGRRACVSCGAAISLDAVLCPKCGWTQPQIV